MISVSNPTNPTGLTNPPKHIPRYCLFVWGFFLSISIFSNFSSHRPPMLAFLIHLTTWFCYFSETYMNLKVEWTVSYIDFFFLEKFGWNILPLTLPLMLAACSSSAWPINTRGCQQGSSTSVILTQSSLHYVLCMLEAVGIKPKMLNQT